MFHPRASFFFAAAAAAAASHARAQLILVEEPKEKIVKAIGAMTDQQVATLMAPSADVTAKRAETLAGLAKLREAEAMIYEVSRMDTQPAPPLAAP